MRKAIFYTHHYEVQLPPGHRFPMQKYRMLHQALVQTGLAAEDELLPAPLAALWEIERVHTPMYVRAFVDGSLPPSLERRIGIPWSPVFVQRTLASVGATLEAARTAMVTGFGAALSGGTHHAFPDYGEGFCVFNDLAIAATMLLEEYGVHRIAIVDLDVHQGNGTAAIFQDHPAVFTLSIHAANNYPFRKERSSLDIALPDGCGDAQYLEALDRALEGVARFEPEVILYQAGVDVIREDRLGRLNLSLEGVYQRDKKVLQFAYAQNIPIVLTMGGGYGNPLEQTIAAHLRTYSAVREIFTEAPAQNGPADRCYTRSS